MQTKNKRFLHELLDQLQFMSLSFIDFFFHGFVFVLMKENATEKILGSADLWMFIFILFHPRMQR